MSGNGRDEWIVVTEDAKTLPVIELLTGRGFVTGKSGSGKSVLEGTVVYTEDGRKPIEDVDEGEMVLSLNKTDYQQEFREILATIEHESDELIRITLEDGTEIVGTEDHSFLTVNDMEIVPVRGDELEEGTWFPLSRELPSIERIEQIDLAEYITESRDLEVRETEIRSGQRTDERYLTLDFDTGKVLGLYLAEGSLSSRVTVQIANIDDDVKSFLDSQGFAVYERTSNRAFKPFGAFIEAEFGRGSGSKALPEWVYEAPESFKAGLISGYIDGDGTVNSTVAMMSKSGNLVEGIKELLRQFGISATINQKFVVYNGAERRYRRLVVDSFCLERLAEIVDLSVDDKADKLDTLVADRSVGTTYNSKDMIPGFGSVLNLAAREQSWTTRTSPNRTRSASLQNLTRKQKAGRETFNQLVDDLGLDGRARRFGQSDIQWKRIVDIEPLDGTHTVYDLDVRMNDNFVANGVFVHNSNTAGVIAEELLANGYNLLIVDTEGEHFTLKEQFELLHVGGDEFADVEVGPAHAKKIASVAIEQNVPVILDVSGYYDAADAQELITAVLEHIYRLEKTARKPFLIMVEEMQEYLPQKGGGTELAELLERIAKRGRKRGLGICGMSQRPSSVDKDFITQCDWMVWHRLTWETDVNVVRNILGSDRASDVQDFEPGQGILMTDWDDTIETVRFKRKRTQDAGATPGLGNYERPDLKTVGSSLIREIKGEGAAELHDENDDPFDTDDEEATLDVELEPIDEQESSVEPASTETDLEESTQESDPDLETERRKNELLSAEIEELRSILEGVEGQNTAPTVGGPTTAGNDSHPRPPKPPRRPPERVGVAGTIVEFGHMLVFLVRSAIYRLRLAYHNQRHL